MEPLAQPAIRMTPFHSILRRPAEALMSIFYPEVCDLCGLAKAGAEESYVCKACRTKVRPVEKPFCEKCGRHIAGQSSVNFKCGNCRGVKPWFSEARSAARAEDKMLDAIHRYKYNRAMWLEPYLASVLLDAALPALELMPVDIVVPVPLHSVKERERGFNQAARLAGHLASALNAPMNISVLRRVIPTPSQTRLGRAERRENVRKAFAVKGTIPSGTRVLLVDDVFTTGATVNECARMLRKAGAGDVRVWTLGRANG